MNYFVIDKIINDALIEDIPNEDITTSSMIDEKNIGTVELLSKQDGIIAGLEIFKRVFEILGEVEIDLYKCDGDKIFCGEKLAFLKGNARKILLGERVALNLLQRMSGIATLSNKFVKEIEDTKVKLLDTRKTTPNLRILEKYSVKVGGGYNHRFNLSDGIMIKDNHINAVGGIKRAVKLCRDSTSFVRKIEVETESIDMVREAIEAEVDIIMLDNMNLKEAKKAVELINKNTLIEFSGNVNLENIKEIAEIGVDFISVGALTHSANILDLSMKNFKII